MGKEYKKEPAILPPVDCARRRDGILNVDLIKLTPEQQKKVGEIAQNVYRPSGNSTWFPDCNHGMAALAAIELMVAAIG
jgi:hypothetical protein